MKRKYFLGQLATALVVCPTHAEGEKIAATNREALKGEGRWARARDSGVATAKLADAKKPIRCTTMPAK